MRCPPKVLWTTTEEGAFSTSIILLLGAPYGLEVQQIESSSPSRGCVKVVMPK